MGKAVKNMTVAEKLKYNYAKLEKMNAKTKAMMEEAYQFAKDNALVYTPPRVVMDNNGEDDSDENDWDHSSC